MNGRSLVIFGAVAIAGLGLLATAARAGTPYTCNCEGKQKRFIGGSHACEILRHDPKDAGIVARKRRPCTQKEYRSFLKDVCASNQCKPWRW